MIKNPNFFKAAFLNLDKPILIFESKTQKIIFANPEAEKLFNYHIKEFKKLTLLSVLSDKKREINLRINGKKGLLKLEFVKKNKRKFSRYAEVKKFRYSKKNYLCLTIYGDKDFIPVVREVRIAMRRKDKDRYKDPLTRLLNYKVLMKKLKEEFESCKAENGTFSLIMLDIDNFDFINETLGLEEGDKILKNLAHLIVKNTRTEDIVGRVGEDAFLIVLPRTDKKGAYNLAIRIFNAISSISIYKNRRVIKISSTLSVTGFPEDKSENPGEILRRAKSLIASAKEMGGNTVAISDEYLKTAGLIKDLEKRKGYTSFQNQLQLLTKKLQATILETVSALSTAVKAKDYYTEKHSEFTAYYAGLLAQKLNLDPDEVDTVKIGAILHDIGKIGISDEILNKRGPLNEKERELINLHPEIGANIIRTIKFLKDVIPIILYHHERYDGKNNRWGLKGKEIPIGARIVSVIDVYHALVSDRPYRKALSKRDAIQIIKSESGKMFDPEVVKALLKILGEENRF